MANVEGKSGVLAAILSVIIPGLGQFYTGQVGKGIMFIILLLVAGGLVSSVVGAIIGIPMFIILPIWAAIDAYMATKTP